MIKMLFVQLRKRAWFWSEVGMVCKIFRRCASAPGLTNPPSWNPRSATGRDADFLSEMAFLNPSMFVWLDETGSDHCNNIHHYGYGLHERYHSSKRKRVLLIGVRSMRGTEACTFMKEQSMVMCFMILPVKHYSPPCSLSMSQTIAQ